MIALEKQFSAFLRVVAIHTLVSLLILEAYAAIIVDPYKTYFCQLCRFSCLLCLSLGRLYWLPTPRISTIIFIKNNVILTHLFRTMHSAILLVCIKKPIFVLFKSGSYTHSGVLFWKHMQRALWTHIRHVLAN